ncbi:cytochrome P450 7A1 isoform X2 [Silurus meridionalis]|uniref:cytochrome P450 7A1 isoform X2 n=1 Tax=Silurus meridionalis TaxID=175797 RepID=UPI001EEA708F|nr:cytochrome P450 7A1 isoform X2 [Silurus meridionalis]
MATWILVAFLLVGVCFLLSRGSRTRRAKEPPLVKGWPYFGVILDYGKNPLAFLQAMRQKHGDIFTCQLAGKHFTFVTDPFSFSAVMRQGKNLDFHKFAMGFSQRVFGHCDFTSSLYTEAYREVHSLFIQTLQGPSLQRLSQNMLGNLQTAFQHCKPSGNGWKEDGLQCFTTRIMFEAGFVTLFGKQAGLLQPEGTGSVGHKVKEDFLEFDGAFPALAAGIPIALCRRAWRAREALAKKLLHGELHHRMCISDLIQRRMDAFDRMHLNETEKARTNVCMLWASQANTLPAAFWSLYYTLRTPEAFAAAYKEVELIMAQLPNDTPISLSKEQLESMTVLESIIREALRLSSASIMIRLASDDFILTMDSGQEAAIRKGDYIALYPRLIHLDPDIYPNPMEFMYNRFLDKNGERRSQFYKNGRQVKHYLVPFGSGASECPGRFFAMNEIKLFLMVVLWHYDLQLNEPQGTLSPDRTRAGLGILPPSQDVLLQYRIRADRYMERSREKEF